MPFTRRNVLRSGTVLAAGALYGRSLSGKMHGEFPQSHDQSWTLENDLIRRQVGFRPGLGLYTAQLSGKATQTDLLLPDRDIAKARPEFSFNCDGKSCASNSGDFELIEANPAGTANGNSLSVRLTHKGIALEIAAVYAIFTGHPACRKTLVLKNTGTATLRITHLAIETLELALGPENEITLLHSIRRGPREIFYTGRSEDAGIMVAKARQATASPSSTKCPAT